MRVRPDRLRHEWEVLGREDALWAVYVREDTKGGGWDRDEFLATGEQEVAGAWSLLGPSPARPGLVLDFGCGVGRLTRALAARADRVVGIDIADSMLAVARDLCADTGNVDLVLSDSPQLPLRDGTVDVAYSSLVLQHLPRVLALGYVGELLRVLAPTGTAIVQVATRPDRSLKGWLFRLLPARLYGWAQVRLLHYPARMRMQALPVTDLERAAAARGWRVAEVVPDTTYGGHWHYERVVLRRA